MVLQRRDANGNTLFDHCLVVEEQTGKWPEAYPPPQVPQDGVEIWTWYWDLRAAAAYGASGPGPLAFTEIEAWTRLVHVQLTPIDIQLLYALDQVYLGCWYEEQARRNKSKGS